MGRFALKRAWGLGNSGVFASTPNRKYAGGSPCPPNQTYVRARFADAMAAVAVEVRRPSALRISDDAVRQAARRSRKRGLSGTRHHGRAGRHAPRRSRKRIDPAVDSLTAVYRHSPQRRNGVRAAPRAAPKAAPESSRLASVFRLGLAALSVFPSRAGCGGASRPQRERRSSATPNLKIRPRKLLESQSGCPKPFQRV